MQIQMLKIFDAEELWTCACGHVPMTAAGFDDHWIPLCLCHSFISSQISLSFSDFLRIFLSFIYFFFSPPFYPLENYIFLCNCVFFNLWCLFDLASFKKYFVIECLLRRRRYLIAIAARKDFCSISKIHPILMYNLRVSYTCRRSLVITCKQSVCYLYIVC